jgi:hypothetical protein
VASSLFCFERDLHGLSHHFKKLNGYLRPQLRAMIGFLDEIKSAKILVQLVGGSRSITLAVQGDA